MKINEPLRPAGATRRKEATRSSGSGFTVPAGRATGPSGPAPGAPLAAPGAVLSLQEVEEAPDGRRRATERGHDMLDELENLRLAMVEGRVSDGALRRLASMVGSAGFEVDDDRLAGVLRDIEVRAAVEIAKREVDESS